MLVTGVSLIEVTKAMHGDRVDPSAVSQLLTATEQAARDGSQPNLKKL